MKPKEPYHLSGHLHVTGRSKFIGDKTKPANMLHAKILTSPHAHAKIITINTKKAEKITGVQAVITHNDIPGINQIGHPTPDQPLLAEKEVKHFGQPIAIVVAKNEKIAEHAIKLIKVKYKKLPAILSINAAIKANSYFAPEQKRKIERGNISKAFANSDYVIKNSITTGTQEHIYLETQRCWAIPEENKGITLYSATQSTSVVQEIVAHVLGLTRKEITVDVKRLGGAFGGKEGSASISTAALTALAAFITNKPIEFKLSRLEDITWTGKRHPFLGEYKIGFNKNGKINAYEITLYANGGAYTDLTLAILERAMLHCDNTYFIPNIKIIGHACKTNLPANTAFRGFGAPQSIFMIETALEKIAYKLQMDPIKVREINLYKSGQTAPYGQTIHEACSKDLFKKLKYNCKYDKLIKSTQAFNRKNKSIKRGIGITPVKFGISFTQTFLNQGSSSIWIYSDGSLSLSHGGIEMGQELNTKVAFIVARELGINLEKIRIESANTKLVGNTSPTAASTGPDINGNAALIAAQQLKQRLTVAAIQLLKTKFDFNPLPKYIMFENNKIFDARKKHAQIDFNELAKYAYLKQVNLGAHGFYKVPGLHYNRTIGQGTPFYYYVFGACLAQVEIDLLTGANKLLKVFIVHEAAKSLNKAIDLGQITGAFYQGFGWSTMEENNFDSNGQYLASTLSTYKIPTFHELPEVFDIDLVELKRKHASVMNSKAIGEPPFIYGEATYFAIKNAIESINNHQIEVHLNMPATPENIIMASAENN